MDKDGKRRKEQDRDGRRRIGHKIAEKKKENKEKI